MTYRPIQFDVRYLIIQVLLGGIILSLEIGLDLIICIDHLTPCSPTAI